MPTAITMAVTMIHSSSAIPTAVMTESREKTMSSTMISRMVPSRSVLVPLVLLSASSPSTISKIS